MICDLVEIHKYRHYKYRPGPFVFTFYYEDSDGTNFMLYEKLKSLEMTYNDVPIMRYDYENFKQKFPCEKLPSHNHIMIVEKNEKNRFFKTLDIKVLSNILLDVRNRRIHRLKSVNKLLKNSKRRSIRPWVVQSGIFCTEDIYKMVLMKARTQYEFPNCTKDICIPRKKNLTKTSEQKSELTSTPEKEVENKINFQTNNNFGKYLTKSQLEYQQKSNNTSESQLKNPEKLSKNESFKKTFISPELRETKSESHHNIQKPLIFGSHLNPNSTYHKILFTNNASHKTSLNTQTLKNRIDYNSIYKQRLIFPKIYKNSKTFLSPSLTNNVKKERKMLKNSNESNKSSFNILTNVRKNLKKASLENSDAKILSPNIECGSDNQQGNFPYPLINYRPMSYTLSGFKNFVLKGYLPKTLLYSSEIIEGQSIDEKIKDNNILN